MNRKGVYFSFDAIIASVIFILTIISLLSYWYSVRETVMSEDPLIAEEALRISNLLFLPSEDSFGFALSHEDKSLDVAKIINYENKYFPDEEMERMRQDLSVPYNFTVTFEIYTQTMDGLQNYEDHMLGVKPSGNIKTYSKVVRIASTSDGRIAIVSVALYR